MGCFVRGGKNGMGCFVGGDKNCMGCFVRGGKLMRDVLSGVAKNGMGCFVPGCFVLHSAQTSTTSLRPDKSQVQNQQANNHVYSSQTTPFGPECFLGFASTIHPVDK